MFALSVIYIIIAVALLIAYKVRSVLAIPKVIRCSGSTQAS